MTVLAGSLGVLSTATRRGEESGPAGPTDVVYTQSSNFGGLGVAPASTGIMVDGLAEPFVGTNQGVGQNVTASFAEAFVTSVTVAASTLTGGWGPEYLNSAYLEYTLNGTDWTNVMTLNGFTAGSFQTLPLNVTATKVRVRHNSNQYLAIGELRLA